VYDFVVQGTWLERCNLISHFHKICN
jgi:hypothetical protein